MKVLKLIFLFVYASQSSAQIGDSLIHLQMADRFVKAFNTKQYKVVYDWSDKNYKTNFTENDFNAYLEGVLFKQYGKIEHYACLSFQKSYYVFLVEFTAHTLQMNLAVSENGQISAMEFIPYSLRREEKNKEFKSDNPLLSSFDTLVNDVVREYIQNQSSAGLSLALYQQGKWQTYNYGVTSRASKQLASNTTIYEIGSLSTTFTGYLLAQAVIEKKLNLNDDITNYLLGNYPNLLIDRQSIKIMHLVNHTAGFPQNPYNLQLQKNYDSLNPYKNYTKKMILDFLHVFKPTKVPGTVCEYSNFGMALLGMILESVYAKNYETLVKEKICLQNNMESTGIHLTDAQHLRFAKGYDASGGLVPHWELGAFSAAGGLRTDLQDMMNYLQWNLEEKDSALKLSHQITFNKNESLAFAWQIRSKKFGDDLYWHNGGTYGSRSFCGFIKEKGTAIVVLTNTALNVDYMAISLLKKMIN